jgi:hypothetical protein
MSHKHNLNSSESIDSSSESSLTSLSSTSSLRLSSLSSVISVRDDVFKQTVNDLKTGPTLLQILVKTAETLIDTIANNEQANTFKYNGITLKLNAVLAAMLHHGEECGGIDGKRYTASAISLCAVQDDTDEEKTLQMLRDLAQTWVSHLLFICERQLFD